MGKEKENPGMAGAFLKYFNHQHQVAIDRRPLSGLGERPGQLAKLGSSLDAPRASARNHHLTTEELPLDEHHQVRAVEVVGAIRQADEALHIYQLHVKIPGSVNWFALSFTACWRMM